MEHRAVQHERHERGMAVGDGMAQAAHDLPAEAVAAGARQRASPEMRIFAPMDLAPSSRTIRAGTGWASAAKMPAANPAAPAPTTTMSAQSGTLMLEPLELFGEHRGDAAEVEGPGVADLDA